MSNPVAGDVIVRSQIGDPTEASFLLIDPIAHQVLSGPFSSLSEAINVADRLIAADGHIWQENLDLRGRPLGPPILLPPLSRQAV